MTTRNFLILTRVYLLIPPADEAEVVRTRVLVYPFAVTRRQLVLGVDTVLCFVKAERHGRSFANSMAVLCVIDFSLAQIGRAHV